MAEYRGLNQVGAQQQALQQAQYDAAQSAYNYNQMAPWQQAQMYAGLLSGGGNYGTTSQPIYSNQGGGMVGWALSGAAAAGPLWATNPYIGAGLVGVGALGGLMQ